MTTDKEQPRVQDEQRAQKAGPLGEQAARPRRGRRVSKLQFPVVAIGASAGGLEPLQELLAKMPAENGLAIVVVQHLDPARPSHLAEVVRRFTTIPVHVAQHGMRLQPNCLFIAAPNQALTLQGTVLRARKLGDGVHHTIDIFFQSVARSCGPYGTAIILSGTGSDGTQGLREVKAELGMVMAQDPKSARFDSMPRSAIETGLVDFVLRPGDMPAQLLAYVEQLARQRQHERVAGIQEDEDALRKILYSLKSRSGHDFSNYKEATIRRRIARRMGLHGINDISQYLDIVRDEKDEAQHLFSDLLIKVTGFFRDPEAWDALKVHLRQLIADKAEGGVFRAWVAGCSTGEEAYSIAVLVRECMDELQRHLQVQIFATDIDEDALRFARRGEYLENIADQMSKDRLKSFFVNSKGHFHVKKDIRDTLMFSPQNLAYDPPFPRLDLVSCRNLLIYMNSRMQHRILPLFHFSLVPEGVLFLGTSETIGTFTNLFDEVERKQKIFRRKEGVTLHLPDLDFARQGSAVVDHPRVDGSAKPMRDGDLARRLQEVLAQEYVPPTVVIDESFRVVYVHGRTGKYLELAPGEADLSLVQLARPGIKNHLLSAVHAAQSRNAEARVRHIRVEGEGGETAVTLAVRPIFKQGLLMVSFLQETPPADGDKAPRTGRRVPELERELRESREVLQSSIEEAETANEELKSIAEEYQATNEELQSANEELESSREELQSVNEELMTTNTDLQHKNDELTRVNDDIQNLLNSSSAATVFLDNDLRISRYAPEATSVLNLIMGDVGRPIGHTTSRLKGVDLRELAKKVLDSLRSEAVDVETDDGKWYSLRIAPYKTRDNIIAGVVLSFIDLTDLKASERFGEAVIGVLTEPVLMLDGEQRVIAANPAFGKVFDAPAEQAVGKHIYALNGGQWNSPDLRRLLEDVLPRERQASGFRLDVETRGGRAAFAVNARLREGGGPPFRTILAFQAVEGGDGRHA